MHLFFDFMVWPRTPWPTLYMRIRRVVLRGKGVLFVSILTWPRTELSRNTMLPLYSLVCGQNIAKFWGEIILKGLSHQTFTPQKNSNFLIWEAI